MQARTIGTPEEIVRAKAKIGKKVVSPTNGKARTDRRKGKSRTKGSSKGSMQHSSQSEEEIHFCILSESKVQNQRHEVPLKEDALRVDTRKALSILETIRGRRGRGTNIRV